MCGICRSSCATGSLYHAERSEASRPHLCRPGPAVGGGPGVRDHPHPPLFRHPVVPLCLPGGERRAVGLWRQRYGTQPGAPLGRAARRPPGGGAGRPLFPQRRRGLPQPEPPVLRLVPDRLGADADRLPGGLLPGVGGALFLRRAGHRAAARRPPRAVGPPVCRQPVRIGAGRAGAGGSPAVGRRRDGVDHRRAGPAGGPGLYASRVGEMGSPSWRCWRPAAC